MLIRTSATGYGLMRDQGICASCGKSFHVNGRTGYIRKHYVQDGRGMRKDNGECPGSGQAPAPREKT